ncbi:hypothetical protein EMIT0111MI5_20400 [Burkholderia sp. IT-111MI5]
MPLRTTGASRRRRDEFDRFFTHARLDGRRAGARQDGVLGCVQRGDAGRPALLVAVAGRARSREDRHRAAGPRHRRHQRPGSRDRAQPCVGAPTAEGIAVRVPDPERARVFHPA